MTQIIRVLAALLLFGSVAERTGAAVIYTGGEVTVTSLWSDSRYMSTLNLYSSDYHELTYLTTKLPGQAVTFNPANFGIKPGDELIFGIHVLNTGQTYFMGAAGRNLDRVVHARVESQRPGAVLVGYEDLFGGGDRDYNDLRFLFTGGVGDEYWGTRELWSIPEPNALALLGLGLLGVVLVRRRRLN